MTQEPAFVVVEGPDGIGKSTLVKGLAAHLTGRNFKVCSTMEPSEGPVGLAINYMLSQKEAPIARTMALLFAADRSHHVDQVIRPALARGEVVICDRYDLSTMVYQLAQGMKGVAQEAPFVGEPPFVEGFSWDFCLKWLIDLNSMFVRPDVTLVLRGLPVEITMHRIAERKGKEVSFEKVEFQRKVHALYDRAEKLRVGHEAIVFLTVHYGETPDEVLARAIESLERCGRVPMFASDPGSAPR